MSGGQRAGTPHGLSRSGCRHLSRQSYDFPETKLSAGSIGVLLFADAIYIWLAGSFGLAAGRDFMILLIAFIAGMMFGVIATLICLLICLAGVGDDKLPEESEIEDR